MIATILGAVWRSNIGKGVILAVLAVIAILAWVPVFRLWLELHDANVASVARAGYVLESEKTAAVAKADELQRQINAGALALEEHRKRLLAAELVDQQKSAEREQEILDYEMRLSQANRRCAISRDDIDFLQHSGKAPDQRRHGTRSIPGKSKPTGVARGLPEAGAPRGPR